MEQRDAACQDPTSEDVLPSLQQPHAVYLRLFRLFIMCCRDLCIFRKPQFRREKSHQLLTYMHLSKVKCLYVNTAVAVDPHTYIYGVAMISRLLKILFLFCKRAL